MAEIRELNPTEQDRLDAERHMALLKRYNDSSLQDILTDLFFLIQLAMFRERQHSRTQEGGD